RLDGGHVEHADVDALLREALVGDDRGGDHESVGDDGRVAAFAELRRASEFEVGGLCVVHQRDLGTAEPQVDGAAVPVRGAHGRAHLELVTRDADDEAGQATGKRDVFDRLLAGAVLARRDAAVAARDLDVEPRVGDRHTELVEALEDEEAGEARDERDLAAGREATRHPDHVGFLDADVEEPVGDLLGEERALGALGEVGVEDDDVVVLTPQVPQRLAVGVASGLAQLEAREQLVHRPSSRYCAASRSMDRSALGSAFSSSASARASSSSVGATPWYAFSPSMKLTPLPLMVCAMMHAGPCSTAHSRALRTWLRSWPSISRTFQRMARHLSANGSRSMMSAIAPSSWYLL